MVSGEISAPRDRSFAILRPEEFKQWDFQKNEVDPYTLPVSSRKRIHWIDSFGHRWTGTADNMGRGKSKCNYCNGRSLLKGFNDLETLLPASVGVWSHDRNGDLKPSDLRAKDQSMKIWIICPQGHGFSSTAWSLVYGNKSCEYCSGIALLLGVNDLATTHPNLAKEWSDMNSKTPYEIKASSDSWTWFICPSCGGEWKTRLINRAKGRSNCYFCSNKKVLSGFNDLQSLDSNVAEEFSKLNGNVSPSEVLGVGSRHYWWTCEDGHNWRDSVGHRREGRGCHECSKLGSIWERKVFSQLKAWGEEFVLNSFPIRDSNGKMQIDILIPSRKIAIEVQDFATHSRDSDHEEIKSNSIFSKKLKYKRGPSYHARKRAAAERAGYYYYELWQDSILDKTSLIQELKRILVITEVEDLTPYQLVAELATE